METKSVRALARLLGWTIVTTLALAACGGDTTGPEEDDGVAGLEIVGGGEQELGAPGASLPDPIVVQVTEKGGMPLREAGIAVEWSAELGGGTVSGEATTDADGRASGVWNLGPTEGTNRLMVTAEGRRAFTYAVAVGRIRPVVYLLHPTDYVGAAGTRLFMADPDGSNATPLTSGVFTDKGPEWSPDGTRLAFIRQFDETCSSLQGDVMILDVTSLELRRLTDDGPCVTGEFVSWSPDGTRLTVGRSDDIVVIDLSDGSRSTIAQDPDREVHPVWGDSGIAYARRVPTEPTSTYLADPDGSDTRMLLGDGVDDFIPAAWDPSGSVLGIFRKRPTGSLNFSLWLYDAETGDLSAAPTPQGAAHAAWSPGGTTMLVSVHEFVPDDCGQAYSHIVAVDLQTEATTDFTAACAERTSLATWRPGT